MKIRKLMAIVMAGVMVMGFSGTVFAAEVTEPGEADTTVTWTNGPTYSVTIPSTIDGADLQDKESGLELSATYDLAPGTGLVIFVANSVLMQRTGDTDSTNSLTLNLAAASEDGFELDRSMLTWRLTGSGSAQSASIYTTSAMPTKAGDYTAIITFNIAYEEAETAS